jgi:DNA-binding Xre family transcriptional regulator
VIENELKGGIAVKIGEAVKLRILELCNEKKITVNRLSTLCGITQSPLSNIISGRNQSTTVSTVKKICDGLEISVTSFFSSSLFDELEQEIQ